MLQKCLPFNACCDNLLVTSCHRWFDRWKPSFASNCLEVLDATGEATDLVAVGLFTVEKLRSKTMGFFTQQRDTILKSD